MGKLITVVGNSGSGKTTLAKRLCETAPFIPGLEEHEGRPFQKKFATDLHRYAFPNQIDYLLYRAEQERSIRGGDSIGVQDGGLDQDFLIFTRHFFLKGYLSHEEYKICERMHTLLRCALPPPDLIIRLVTDFDVIAVRYTKRDRKLNIVKMEDLAEIENLLKQWLDDIKDVPIITIDTSSDDYTSSSRTDELLLKINDSLEETT